MTEAEKILETARMTIENAQFCSLITLDAGGQPQSRIMEPFAPEADFTIWMGTHRATRKVSEISADGRVTLAWYDPKDVGYVTVIAQARLVDDLALRRRYWKPQWDEFYPGGAEGDRFILIECVPQRIEVMNYRLGVGAHPTAFKPAAAQRVGDSWQVDETLGVE